MRSNSSRNPLDPAIGIDWPTQGRDGTPLTASLSPKDAEAPTLAELTGTGLLPAYDAVQEFVAAFEEVFDRDWAHTRSMLGIHSETPEQKKAAVEMGLESIPVIADDGTFLHPKVEDEVEDWGNRGRLLAAYRELKKAAL